MAKLDLTQYGITGSTVIAHNPSYEQLFAEETKAGLEGFEVGQQTELGAVNVMTGIYTGRSPKDKYIVMTRTLRTLYGGLQRSTRTITTRCLRKFGTRLRLSLRKSSATRTSM